jgi:hypothetical protein
MYGHIIVSCQPTLSLLSVRAQKQLIVPYAYFTHTWRGRILIKFCNGHKAVAGVAQYTFGIELGSLYSILGKSKGCFSTPQHSYRPCDWPNAHLALFSLGSAASPLPTAILELLLSIFCSFSTLTSFQLPH